MLKSLAAAFALTWAPAELARAQVGYIWAYSAASPNGNAYINTPYGAYQQYPLGAYVGGSIYGPYCWPYYYRRPYVSPQVLDREGVVFGRAHYGVEGNGHSHGENGPRR